MENTKIMDFTAFSKSTPLQDPKNALKGDNVTPPKKESFVDQVKHSDLSTLTTNKPDYSQVNENEQAAALVSEITAIERQIVDLQTTLQTKKEALQQVVTTTTTTTLPPTSGTQPATPAVATTPGTTPIVPAVPAATPIA